MINNRKLIRLLQKRILQFSTYRVQPGVGKTYTANSIIKKYLETLEATDIVVLAPSHQAKAVIASMIDNKDIEVNTIQSHCKFIPKWERGEQVFKHTGAPANKKKVAIVDEISMVEMNQFNVLKKSTGKIICLGDKNQLTPVGSKQMDLSQIKVVELTEQMRQKRTDTSLYESIQRVKYAVENNTPVNMDGIKPDDSLILTSERKVLFNSYLVDESKSKVLVAATNVLVDRYNLEVKKAIGDDIYEPGDILILQAPYWIKYDKDASSDLKNGDIVEIKSVTDDGEYLLLRVSYIDTDELIDLLIPKDKDVHATFVDVLKQECIRGQQPWIELYKLKHEIGLVKHAHSMTVNKTQGSTFDNVYIDLKDLKQIVNWSGYNEYARGLYVALSRARSKVTVLI